MNTLQTDVQPHPMRLMAVWAGSSALAVGAVTFGWPDRFRADADLDRLITDLAGLVLAIAAGWIWLVTTVVVGSELLAARGPARLRTLLIRLTPRGHRVAILALCGVGLAVPLTAGPALADGPDRPGRAVLAGLPFPDRAPGSAQAKPVLGPPAPDPEHRHTSPERHTSAPPVIQHRPTAQPSTQQANQQSAERPAEQVGRHARTTPTVGVVAGQVRVVAAGDSLWSITAALLGPDATDAQITDGWHLIHDLNRAVIGDDPDLIHPGQSLRIPQGLPHLVQEQP